ncbi:MAG TPA: Rieske 2Fe-2S domain-containing protein [Solirubrobacteraceae bacterium]|nr:Rieske 2Fe-2S domain-containing protein [Solirubrobacteraceae bacterium]
MADRRKQTKSRYTADRQIPGAFEGETVTRRRFMTGSVHTLGGLATAAFALPALGFALGPVFTRNKASWQDVGKAGGASNAKHLRPGRRGDFPDNTYIPVIIDIVGGIGEGGKSTVYMRKHNPKLDPPMKDASDWYVALSTRCMHLGCPIRFIGAAKRFVCPCHGGVYDIVGKVAGGPPVRPLDRFYTRVRNGRVELGPRYSVNSELKRFSPRDPGEPLDGIGQYLYPARASTAKP